MSENSHFQRNYASRRKEETMEEEKPVTSVPPPISFFPPANSQNTQSSALTSDRQRVVALGVSSGLFGGTLGAGVISQELEDYKPQVSQDFKSPESLKHRRQKAGNFIHGRTSSLGKADNAFLKEDSFSEETPEFESNGEQCEEEKGDLTPVPVKSSSFVGGGGLFDLLDDPDIERHKIETGEKRIICDWGDMEQARGNRGIPRAKSASKHVGQIRRDSRQKLDFLEESKGMDVSLPFNAQKSPKAIIPRSKIKLSRNNPSYRFQGSQQAAQTDFPPNIMKDPIDILKTLPVGASTKRGIPTSAGNKKEVQPQTSYSRGSSKTLVSDFKDKSSLLLEPINSKRSSLLFKGGAGLKNKAILSRNVVEGPPQIEVARTFIGSLGPPVVSPQNNSSSFIGSSSRASPLFAKPKKRMSRPIAFGSKVPLDSINQTISVRPPEQQPMLPLVKAADYVPNHIIQNPITPVSINSRAPPEVASAQTLQPLPSNLRASLENIAIRNGRSGQLPDVRPRPLRPIAIKKKLTLNPPGPLKVAKKSTQLS